VENGARVPVDCGRPACTSAASFARDAAAPVEGRGGGRVHSDHTELPDAMIHDRLNLAQIVPAGPRVDRRAPHAWRRLG
jgi:hypothetical protein